MGAIHAPYGYALRDAATGEVLFGEYADRDHGFPFVPLFVQQSFGSNKIP